MQRPSFSIRVKILSLIILSLVTSLAVYSYVGSNLIVADKSSYIFDFIFSKVKFASQSIELDTLRVVHFLEKINPEDPNSPSKEFYQFKDFFHINGLEIFTPESKQGLNLFKILGGDLKVSKFPWSVSDFDKRTYRYQVDTTTGNMLIGMKKTQNQFYLTQFKLSSSDMMTGSGIYNLLIMDAADQVEDEKLGSEKDQASKVIQEIRSVVKNSKFASGVREIQVLNKDFLTGYDRVLNGNLIVISLVPKDTAFLAAHDLVIKSIVLGVGIFFLVAGLALLLVRGILIKIKELVAGTIRVSAGDFDTQIKLEGQDELNSLADSFNLMSERIKALIIETADKARMSKELETASLVQTCFIPSVPFESESIKIYGSSMNASECSGDWWQYAQVRDYVILVMGDVTGHGVSAALITAIIYSTYSNFLEALKQIRGPLNAEEQILNPLLNLLNQAIASAHNAEAAFPCVAAAFNLKTKQFWSVNAGHITPFIFNRTTGQFGLMKDAVDLPLGQYREVHRFGISESKLELGDQLFWYTDGLFDERSSDGVRIKKKSFFRDLANKLQESEKSKPIILSELALQEAQSFFGSEPKNRPDDITILSIF